MTIKQQGGIFGRNPTFNEATIETADINGGTVNDITSLSVSGSSDLDGAVTVNASQADVDFVVKTPTFSDFLQVDAGNERAEINAKTTPYKSAGDFNITGGDKTAPWGNLVLAHPGNGYNAGFETSMYMGLRRADQLNGNQTMGFRTTVSTSNATGANLLIQRGRSAAGGTTAPDTFIDVFKIDKEGNTTVSEGNLVIGTSGKGIDFSATSGTGTSELFSDYEEGTFSPNLLFGGANTGMTYSAQTGLYTKIGNAVVFSIRIVLTAKGSSTGNASISGLPFTAGSTFRGNFSVFHQSVNIDTAGGYYTFCAQPNPSNTTLTLREVGDNIAGAAITNSDFSDTSLVDICGTYRT